MCGKSAAALLDRDVSLCCIQAKCHAFPLTGATFIAVQTCLNIPNARDSLGVRWTQAPDQDATTNNLVLARYVQLQDIHLIILMHTCVVLQLLQLGMYTYVTGPFFV